jgi:hypothetical protein
MTYCRVLTKVAFATIAMLQTSACGLKTPNMVLSGDKQATSNLVIAILGHVHSELGCAIMRAIELDQDNNKKSGRRYAWLDNATAIVTLKLIAEESSSLSPNTLITQPFPNSVTTFSGKPAVSLAQSFTLGAGGSLSSDATRTDITDYTISVKDAYVKKAGEFTPTSEHCSTPYDGILTYSDLQLYDWLDSRFRPLVVDDDLKDVPPKTLTTEINFVVKGSGNITPTWKLIPTSVNSNGTSLFGLNRNDTDDILITISASAADAKAAQDIGKLGSALTSGAKSN